MSPRWMRWCLVAAGVYNLAWGGVMIIAPRWSLNALGVRPASNEVWPSLWACIGMIVGVYGVGYLIASRDPARHWPIVLVGLLGKIFGPIGFMDAASRGELPWSMGVTLITNDLAWWAPFLLMLWHALKVAQPPLPEGTVSLRAALESVRDDEGRTVGSITDERPTLVVLLRHAGCTFCREAIADLADRRARIESAGFGIVVVGMAPTTSSLRALGAKHGLAGVAWVADPDRQLYRALKLGRGRFMQLFGPRVWISGVRAAARGHGIGKLEGDGLQMPGAFVIHRGAVMKSYRHRTAADRPDLEEFACSVR